MLQVREGYRAGLGLATPSVDITPTGKSSDSIHGGALAGIIVGSVVGTVLLVVLIFWVRRGRQKAHGGVKATAPKTGPNITLLGKCFPGAATLVGITRRQ